MKNRLLNMVTLKRAGQVHVTARRPKYGQQNRIHARLEDAILDACDRLLANSGYSEIDLNQLAREADVSKGTIYLHFQTKEEVILALFDRAARRVKAALMAIVARPVLPIEKLREMLLARILAHFDSVQHYATGLPEIAASLHTELLTRCEQYSADESKVVAQTLREGQRRGRWSVPEPLATAEVFVGATNFMLPINLQLRELRNRRDLKRKAGRVIDVLLSGLVLTGRGSGAARIIADCTNGR